MRSSLCKLFLASIVGMAFSSPVQPQTPALVIDGQLDDAFWRNLPAEKLVPSEVGVPAEMGGEVRLAVCGRYLCVAARLPEPSGRITARLSGVNPSWEDEDVLRIAAAADIGDIGNTDRVLQVNPLGAYSVEKALHVTTTELGVYPYSLERKAQTIYRGANKFLVATSMAEKEWTVEAAIPLNELSVPGPDHILVRVERVRALRPGSPQQKWHWPETGPASRVPVSNSRKWDAPAPAFRPAPLGNRELPLEVGRTTELPPLESAWDDAGWQDAPVWKLVRDEATRREPRFPTEVKAVYDGRTLAVLARCVEPGAVVARVKENDGPLGRDDSFHVYLATSGSSYAQFAVNALSYLLDTIGFSGGERLSRAREWDSGSRVLVRQQAGAWTARIDIPLEPVARALGETATPSTWRVLFLRWRPGREGEPPEKGVLPVIQTDTAICPARYRRLVLSDVEPARLAKPQPAPPPAGLAGLDGRVLSAEQRKELRLSTMLDDHLRDRVRKATEAEQHDWEQVKTRSDWERFRDPRIQALTASMGQFPARTPLRTQVTKEFAGNGYLRKDLVYQSRPGLWVTANLYLPAKPLARMPGIVVVHSHHRPRTQAELQDMGILWARAGCAVLIMDQIGHGERLQNYPWNREAYHSRYILGMQLYLAGESLIKWMVWDIMRGIDLLLERKDINPEQIILLGAVAAGGEPAAITAALDSRVAAVVPFGFNEVNPGWGEWESTRCLRRSVVDQFFPWLIGASVAPRHFVYAKEMGWETYGKHLGWLRLQRVFSLYGAPNDLDRAYGFGTFPGPGECSNIGPAQRQTLYPALWRWFGIPIPASEPDDRRPEAELLALTPATASQLEMRTIHDLAHQVAETKLNAARAEMQTLAPEGRRECLKKELGARLGDIEPNGKAPAVVRWNKRLGGSEIEGITVESERGILVPLLLLRPANRAGDRLPVVAAVAQGGKELFLSQRSKEIESLLEGGAAVCLIDVRATGETAPEARRGRNSEEESPAGTEFMLGNTLLGERLKDLRTSIRYLASRKDLDAERIGIWGDSFVPVNPPRLVVDELTGWQVGPELQQQAEPLGGLLALLGALYEDRIRAVVVQRGLVAYLSILDDQFAYIPNDIIVPGILEVADVSDIAAGLNPRPLLLEGLVDGRNRLVPEAALRSRLTTVYDAYHAGRAHLLVRSRPGAPAAIEWILARLQGP